MKTTLLLLASLTLLGGCVTAPDPTRTHSIAQGLPGNYKAQIKEKLKFTLVDPYSLRDTAVTAPTAVFVGTAYGGHAPGVCIRFNPKNNYGAYNGMQTYAVGFRGGKLTDFHPAIYMDCDKAGWRPFPEIAG